jgi:MoaA/NifB/PqqE/SkfB family radical SAM enzyme
MNEVPKSPPRVSRVTDKSQIRGIIEQNRIATLSLRLPVACNLDCKYCFGDKRKDGLSYDGVRDVLRQAKELGMHTVSLVGDGEPLLYPRWPELVEEMHAAGVHVVLFTNGTLMTRAIAESLYALNVSLIGKQNSRRKQVQDFLSGDGAFEKIAEGIGNMKAAGFNKTSPSRLSLHTVVVRQNIAEIPHMWRCWRSENIIPYVQVLAPPAERNKVYWDQLKVSPQELKDLTYKLCQIDRDEFGFSWDPEDTYPIPGMGCTITATSVGITPEGLVQICSYAREPLGDLRTRSLADIVASEKVRRIREFCVSNACHGCRALSVGLTGETTAPDPFFWKTSD